MPSITYDRLAFVVGSLMSRYGTWVPPDAIRAELRLAEIPFNVTLDEARRAGLLRRSNRGNWSLKKKAEFVSPPVPRQVDVRRQMKPPKPRKRPRKLKKHPPLPSDYDADVAQIEVTLKAYDIKATGDPRRDGADALGWAPVETNFLNVLNGLEQLKLYGIWWVRLGVMIHVLQRDIERGGRNTDKYVRYNQYGMIDAYTNFRPLREPGPLIVAFEELVRRNSHHDVPIWLIDLGSRPDGQKPHR